MPRILVIDDDPDVRRSLGKMLTRAGYDVVEAADGTAGVELQHREPADVIITDIFMPGLDGLQTIRQLKKEGSGVKVIAISGGDRTGTVDLKEHAQLMGAFKVLAKPFEMQDVLAAVKAALGA
ncbi:MAG TPA: response regulator [Gemmatimonadales bacterium]|nr:response regulator [Gemmatimonadales bacterium]